jgi:hypothetical protein
MWSLPEIRSAGPCGAAAQQSASTVKWPISIGDSPPADNPAHRRLLTAAAASNLVCYHDASGRATTQQQGVLFGRAHPRRQRYPR